MIKIACAGFPVGRKKYEEKLQTVELAQLFDGFPRPNTIEKWRAEAPKDFDFIVCASKLITHEVKHRAQSSRRPTPGVGFFQNSAAVRQATQLTMAAAETLRSRMVFFQLPAHFAATPDNVKRVQNYFLSTKSNHKIFAWETPLGWPFTLVEKLSFDHRLMPVMNPLGRKKPSPTAPMRYFRLGAEGKTSGIKRFSHDELKVVKAACDLPLCYVVFNNGPTAFEDAVRFQEMVG